MAKSATKSEKPKTCPVSLDEVMDSKPIAIKIGDTLVSAEPKQFKSGSFGFYYGGAVTQMVGDTPVKFQASLILTAHHSGE